MCGLKSKLDLLAGPQSPVETALLNIHYSLAAAWKQTHSIGYDFTFYRVCTSCVVSGHAGSVNHTALVVFSAWIHAQLSNQATLSCLTSTLDFEPKR